MGRRHRAEAAAAAAASRSICQRKANRQIERWKREGLGARRVTTWLELPPSAGKFAFWWRLIKRDKCRGRCEPSGVAVWAGAVAESA